MKKKLLNSITALIICTLCFSSCKKEATIDPAEQFIGNYTGTLNYSHPFIGNGSATDNNAKIAKVEANKIALIAPQLGTPAYFTVSGNTINEVPSTLDMPIDAAGTLASHTETSTGTLVNGTITINGTWLRNGTGTGNFQIVLIKR